MKIKSDFVTNSSSNNYIFIFNENSKKLDDPDIQKYIKKKCANEAKYLKDEYNNTKVTAAGCIDFLKSEIKDYGTVLTIKEENIKNLKKNINKYIKKCLTNIKYAKKKSYYTSIERLSELLILLTILKKHIEKKSSDKLLNLIVENNLRLFLQHCILDEQFYELIRILKTVEEKQILINNSSSIMKITCTDNGGSVFEYIFHNSFSKSIYCFKDMTIIVECWH